MNLSNLVDDVRPSVHGAPNFVMLDALQKSAAEFFYASGVWRENMEPIDLAIGESDYSIPVPPGARALWIVNGCAKLGSSHLRISSPSDLFHFGALSGRPTHVAIEDATGELRVWRIPGASGDLGQITLRVALTLTREATDIPDVQADRWRDGIVAGAKSRLLREPGREWSNPDLAGAFQRHFYEEVAKARRAAESESFARPLQVPMRRW